MEQTFIGVVSHKDFHDDNLPEAYHVVHVGTSNIPNNKKWLSDNIGDNISKDNPYYCELTAQYWMWKNLCYDFKYVGMVHYRRYFMNYHKDSKSFWEDLLTAKDIEETLRNHKIIIPYVKSKDVNGSILYKNTKRKFQSKEWIIIDEIIKTNHPLEYPAFQKIIYGKTQIWSNMFIATREVFNEYSEWLFDVLKEYDNRMINDENHYRIPRVDGFLSELLILVWIEAHISKDEIYHYHVESSEGGVYEKKKNNKLIKFIYSNKLLLDIVMNIRTLLVVLKRCLINRL